MLGAIRRLGVKSLRDRVELAANPEWTGHPGPGVHKLYLTRTVDSKLNPANRRRCRRLSQVRPPLSRPQGAESSVRRVPVRVDAGRRLHRPNFSVREIPAGPNLAGGNALTPGTTPSASSTGTGSTSPSAPEHPTASAPGVARCRPRSGCAARGPGAPSTPQGHTSRLKGEGNVDNRRGRAASARHA